MPQNAKIEISWDSGFIPSAKHTAQDKLISNIFIIILSSPAISYSLFICIYIFSLAFSYPHTSSVICPIPSISTLPTFEFQHIFIFTFMSLSQYHFSSSSISSSVPMPLLQFLLSNFSSRIFFLLAVQVCLFISFLFIFSFLRFICVQNADLLSF